MRVAAIRAGVVGAALAAAAARLSAQASVAVSAPATLAPGEPALVRVEVTAPAAADVRVAPPDVSPFSVASVARVPAPDSGAPRGWRRHEWRYVLAPPRGARGRYTFAPFAAEVGGRGLRSWTVRTRAWGLVVRAPAAAAPAAGAPLAAASAPAGGPGAPATPAGAGRGVTFRARVYPDTVYVGEQATYELTVTVDAAARARIRRNPEFVPPELRGVLAVDVPPSHDASAAGDVHVYRRALFALAPGAVEVPSARLSYALALGNGYFSPEERLSLRTGAVRFTALAPPAAGRPRGWEGAVGSLRASARAAAPSVRAGDPVEFVVRLEGDANVGLLPRPAVAAPWADLVETGDRVEVDSTARTVRGAKEFTWLLTPRTAGAFATPAVRYPYFDPARRAYDELVVPPVALRVRPGGAGPDVVAGPAAARDTTLRLGIRTVWRGAVGPALPSRPGFWLLVALAPAPAALVLAGRAARRRRAARPADPARALRALAAGGPDDPRAVRRAVHAAFAARVGFDPTACAGPTAFARALRRVGVSDHTAADAAACVAALDAAAFDAARDAAPGTAEPAAARALAARAQQVLRDVDAEAQSRAALGAPYAAPPHQRGPRATRAPLLFAAAAAAAGSAAAACAEQRPAAPGGDPGAAAAFARGTAAYQRGDLPAARDAFLAAAALAPAAPDAWANAGTAAWATADTVAAAVGWQRAARLEPTAEDVRERLALLPAAQDGWIAGPMPLHPDWFGWAAAPLALAAGALALRGAAAGHRRPPGAWPWAWGAAIAAGAAGLGVAAHADPAGRAVVTLGGPLRDGPSLAAEPGHAADRTDVARVLGRQAAWVRVALDGGRDGWIESARLVALDAPAHVATAAARPASAAAPAGRQ